MAELEKDSRQEKDESFEVLDLAETGRNWLTRALDGEISTKSVPVQVGIGASSGWVAGYLFQKVGKLAATAVGGGFFIILVGHQTGYLRIDWKRVEKDVGKTQSRLAAEAEKRLPQVSGIFQQGKELLKKNVILSSSFAGGFLLGIAM
ncbi:FUN14 domain-containing protein 1 [Holothuria leucospilota]|uniref:FUN14 domain-containing protein 1 n=1 Tax=Holothuria leucospilota TaxID=206669 RepID=A0A9Q1BQI8_HOLLE|nr:FUN14 domain-containing protein 1 [Holothuria leucospilota]